MIKIRLEGEEPQLLELIRDMEQKGYSILEVSKPYPNRGSQLVRIYVTIKSLN